MTQDAFVLDSVRTPFGRYGGGLAHVRPDDLAAFTIAKLASRTPGLDPERIDDVVLGNANGAGEENRNVARMAALLAGLPITTPGTTVNRLCGSSLDASIQAARAIETGDADVMIAGGVESMSRAPWVMLKPHAPFPKASAQLESTTLGWRLTNPEMNPEWTVSLGEATERLRERHEISRDRQDEFALASHQRASAAWDAGHYDHIVTAVPGTDVQRDETIRPQSSPASLAALSPVFRKDGTVTAGNASPLSDGASAVLLGSQHAADAMGTSPLARIAGRGVAADEPQYFGFAPVEAARIALKRAGISWDDVGAVELNEAFAAQSLACLDAWPIDPTVVNAWGGAIAMGHPLGASGTRVLGTLVERMRVDKVRWGVAALCIGVGQGIAVVVEGAA